MNQKEMLVVAATIFITVIAWVSFEIISIRKQTPTQEEISAVNINYVIDVTILDELKQKKLYVQ